MYSQWLLQPVQSPGSAPTLLVTLLLVKACTGSVAYAAMR